MKIKALIPIIVTGFVIALACNFIAIAAVDAPHNESNNVNCGSCHGQGLLQSPFWGGSMSIDELCQYCHTASSCPIPEIAGPLVMTHTDSNGIPLVECRNCHDPHYQKQKNYKNTDASDLYLAKGKITSYIYFDPDIWGPPFGNTSLLTYDPSSISYKPGWDAAKLVGKTDSCRSAILFPNVKKLGYSFSIVALETDFNRIRIRGDIRPVYQYITTSDFAITYGQYIKDIIDGNTVKFFDQINGDSFADGDATFNGICETCHTLTGHFRASGGAPDQNHTNLGNGIPGVNCVGCHKHTEGFQESGECIDCHSISFNGRAAVIQHFNSESHHIQDMPIMNNHCYECHWEANADGSVNNDYHEGYNTDTKMGVQGEKVDLVVYGAGTRPTTYTDGTTAIQYMADGTRGEIKKLNAHCLSCHSDQNDTTVPFGDGKTPKHYAWDGKSIDARYSQTGTTTWGKYTGTNNAAKKNITKAYSAHGRATSNEGGWSAKDGVDGSISNSRNGSQNVACFDCHNSHGSSVEGPTSSYASATTNGGILKDIVSGQGGSAVTYKPQSGGSSANKNAYNAGAGLCFDCHMNALADSTPWGYGSTFGATDSIMGYWDTPYFGPGTFASKERFGYKVSSHKGGHFGKSSNLTTSTSGPIGGLCTPCHDPHGVSPTINQAYSVPLLKGTWLTSPYKEDTTPSDTRRGTIRTDRGRPGVSYRIDQNTFGSDIEDDSITGITETDSESAGLCLGCHTKTNLLSCGWFGCNWKTTGRIHQSVKDWGGYGKHSYSCSKCHTPHNSRLPRLMVTNCLDSKHKGFYGNNPDPKIKGNGSGDGGRYLPTVCSGRGTSLGFCPEGDVWPRHGGSKDDTSCFGGGRMPGYWGGCKPDDLGTSHRVLCHEAQESDQSWNSKTQWSEEGVEPGILSGPFASNFTAVGTDIRATITWTTRNDSTSYVDYGLTTSYGSTEGSDFMTTNHSITLTGLTNHTTYHYRVRSHDGVDWIESDDREFYISVPPTVPSKGADPDTTCFVPCDITFQWNPSTDPDSGPIEYYADVQDPDTGAQYASGWTTDTEWTVNLPLGYWCWRVKAHDANHTEAESNWSGSSCFNTAPAPSVPAPIAEPDIASTVPVTVTLEWMPSTSPLGNAVEYQFEKWETPLNNWYTSDWISDTHASITLDTEKTYNWHVRARDAVYKHAISNWSATDSFVIATSNPPPAPTLVDEPDVITASVPVDVTLEWEDVDDPEGDPVEYQVWVSESTLFWPRTDSDWMTEAAASCDGSTCSWTVTISTASTWYWEVRARDANHTTKMSAWSSPYDSFKVMTSNPPPTPTLTEEPDLISTVPEDITFEWEDVDDPDGDPVEYQVEICTNTSCWFGTIISSGWMTEAAANCDGSTCSWTTTVNPATYKTWYWKVQARDENHPDATSEWSDIDSFVFLSSNPPPAPTLTDEPDIPTTVPVDVTLEWEDVDDPDGDPVQYDVQVSGGGWHDSGWMTEAEAFCDGSTCSWTVTVANAKTWQWKVQARDATPGHEDAVSAWSDIDYFTTFTSSPPPTPALIDEPNISTTVPVDITLEWEDVDDPDGDPVQYYIQVDDTFIFTAPNHESGWMTEAEAFCDGSTCSWTVTISEAKNWYWKVKARDADHTDAESAYSSFDLFTITGPSGSPENPPAPTLLNEPDDISSVAKDVTLEWVPVTCPDGDPVEYFVEVDDDSDFSSLYDDSGWISETTNCISYRCGWTITLDPDITWYWRVQARDEVHTDKVSELSGVDSFFIHLPIINESFEKNIGVDGTGYDETWNETVQAGCTLDPDAAIPGTITPPDAGSECLQSISADTGYKAFARRNYGSEVQKTFARFYFYVEDEGIEDGGNKYIGAFRDNSSNNVLSFRLNQNAGQLRFRFSVYNNDTTENYYADISLNTWYRVETKYDDTNNTWEWKLYDVDGTLLHQDNGNLTGIHYTGIQRWDLGFLVSSNTRTGTIYYDSFVVNTITYY